LTGRRSGIKESAAPKINSIKLGAGGGNWGEGPGDPNNFRGSLGGKSKPSMRTPHRVVPGVTCPSTKAPQGAFERGKGILFPSRLMPAGGLKKRCGVVKKRRTAEEKKELIPLGWKMHHYLIGGGPNVRPVVVTRGEKEIVVFGEDLLKTNPSAKKPEQPPRPFEQETRRGKKNPVISSVVREPGWKKNEALASKKQKKREVIPGPLKKLKSKAKKTISGPSTSSRGGRGQ